MPVTDPTQAWVGTQSKPRQAMETMISSVRNAVDGDPSLMSQEALLQPVRDMGHSEILRGHFRGTQPFEKGLGFPHRVPELRAWDDVHLKGQVSVLFLQFPQTQLQLIRNWGTFFFCKSFGLLSNDCMSSYCM